MAFDLTFPSPGGYNVRVSETQPGGLYATQFFGAVSPVSHWTHRSRRSGKCHGNERLGDERDGYRSMQLSDVLPMLLQYTTGGSYRTRRSLARRSQALLQVQHGLQGKPRPLWRYEAGRR